MSSTILIRDHLDVAAVKGGYLDTINGTTPESLVDGQMKMHPLRSALGSAAVAPIVSIGIGQGEELHALRTVFGPNVPIMGVDLSRASLERARQRSERFSLGAILLSADASNLPIGSASLSGVVMSSIIHEIFSYNEPDGAKAYQQSIQEAARVLQPQGVLYVREFAPPPQEDPVRLIPLTQEAALFYDYFVNAFAVGLRGGNRGVELSDDGSLCNTGDLTQILLHFKNYWHDAARGLTRVGDPDWKEMKESYVIPRFEETDGFMSPIELSEDIMRVAAVGGFDLELVELSVKMRKKLNLFLEQHFRIEDARGRDVAPRLLHLATAKVEATFRKS